MSTYSGCQNPNPFNKSSICDFSLKELNLNTTAQIELITRILATHYQMSRLAEEEC